jgi:long-chain acyl-CoA synthetase
MNLANWLWRAGSEFATRPALGLGSRPVLDYAGLSARVARLAGGLRHGLALEAGERVALVMGNVPEYVEALFACWHAGLAAVPVNAKLHPAEMRYILDHSGAKACFATADLVSTVEAAAAPGLKHLIKAGGPDHRKLLASDAFAMAEVAPSDLAWLFYTSGTTGQPKGAMLTHRNLAVMTLNYFVDFDRIAQGDAILHAAPMSHGSGLWMLPHVAAGACNVVPESGGFAPDEIFSLMPCWPGLTLFAAPTMVRRLTDHAGDSDTANLKLITYGGGPMYVADTLAALGRFGPKLAQLYGQGESPMTITHLSREDHADRHHPRWHERLGTAGVADSCVEVQVVDGEDGPLPVGEPGEIVCRGDTVMAGYWRNREASEATLKGGWLHTGDIGSFDVHGYLTITGRSKDLIISGGANVYPREVEEVLMRAPCVAQASVIGRPDPKWGEVVVAYVVAKHGQQPSAESLDSFCLEHLARFKRPKVYRFVADLPKNAYGKVLKTELREMEARPEAVEPHG